MPAKCALTNQPTGTVTSQQQEEKPQHGEENAPTRSTRSAWTLMTEPLVRRTSAVFQTTCRGLLICSQGPRGTLSERFSLPGPQRRRIIAPIQSNLQILCCKDPHTPTVPPHP